MLLGGVALGVTASAAQADDLDVLKAQLETLNSRLNLLEAPQVHDRHMIKGVEPQWVTFHRGSDIGWDQSKHARPQEFIPEDRVCTTAITSTADLPDPAN